MVNPNAFQNTQDKLGPIRTPGGLTGGADADAHPQTITDTVQIIGPLPDGAYTVQGDVAVHVINGTAAKLGTPGNPLVNAATVRRLALPIPADATEDVNVDADSGDNYIAWVKKSGAGDGSDFRCHDRTRGYRE